MRNIYITDNTKEIISVLNNSLDNSIKIIEDSVTRRIQDNETSLNLTLAGKGIADISTSNYIIYPIFNDYYLFRIIKKDLEDNELILDCEPTFIQDLNSVIVRPTKFENATIKEILNSILTDTGFTVGEIDNEISYLPEFIVDNYVTVLEVLLNLANITNSEFKAIAEIGNNQVIKQTISFKSKNISYMDVFLTNEDLDTMKVSEDTSELCSELIAIGKNNDEIISLQGIDKEKVREICGPGYNISGDVLVNELSQTLYGKIQRVFETECKNNIELLEKAYAELNVICKPLKIYQCESSRLISDIDYDCLGQYLRLGDEETQSYVSARIVEMSTSVTTPEENSVTFGDYIEEKPVKSDKILELQEQIGKLEQDLAKRNLKLVIETSTGNTIFRNNQGEITLTAKVTKDDMEVNDVVYDIIYTWKRMDAQGNQINFPDGSKNKTGKSIIVKGEDVLLMNSYECQCYVPQEVLK